MKPLLLLFVPLVLFAQTPLPSPIAAGGGGGGGAGDVVGPSSATDAAIALFDGTTGKLLKNSTITIDTTAGRAGGYNMPQGTAATPGTTSVLRQAPASVTSYSVLEAAAVGTTGVRRVSVSGSTATESNGPANLTTDVTGILPSANGGTGNGFTKFSGPTTSEKTFTVPDASSTLTVTVASGAKALDTDAIASTACDTISTTTATGAATTDVVIITPNADITAVTGYAPVTAGGLAIYTWLTTNTLNIKVCNPTSSSITPGAVTLNWRVVR